MSIRRTTLALAATLLATSLAAPLQANEPPLRLNFGVYSSNKPSAMVRVFKPVLRELEQRMGERLGRDVDIRMQIARDYERGITDLTEGRVDFSQFGPASYVEAKRSNPDLRILAMENEKNSRVFYGIIAVAADSDIESVDDLRGRSFAFGDEGSTIGRFLSQLYLEQHGIRAGNLSRYEYLGRHDKVGTAVAAGDFDAGALNEKTFKKLVEAGENLRELVRFPNVTKPWIARSGLDEEIFEVLQASLLEIDDATALAGLKVDGFFSGSDADYNDIRVAIEDNAAFFSEPVKKAPVAAAPAPAPASDAAALVSTSVVPTVTRSAVPEAAPVAAEPALQAAVAGDALVRSGNRIVLNIVLPPTLFATGSDGPSELTINLTIPDASAR